ncbi:hypothetical protein HLI_08245 [Halobacillus litoralis]|uniref:Uncharacterized protein n=1 Tax=Halobacillus litoralis TaxID=45668 RepID=A0A410MC02_9BACI|nr:hypothetical protein HLI_08245 [Halobacillus litoralis]
MKTNRSYLFQKTACVIIKKEDSKIFLLTLDQTNRRKLPRLYSVIRPSFTRIECIEYREVNIKGGK